MTVTTPEAASIPSLPLVRPGTIAAMATAGAFATIAFDIFGQGLAPLFGFAKLAPVPLAKSVLNTVFGLDSTPAAHLLHYFTGVVGYVLGWVLLVQPLARRFAPSLPWWLVATVYGVGLWVFALFFMAHLVAGMPAFLGFSGLTWVALAGHVVYALVLAGVLRRSSADASF